MLIFQDQHTLLKLQVSNLSTLLHVMPLQAMAMRSTALPVTKARLTLTLIAMEVKVDPGSETNCIPLSHFRCLFPQLCREDGNPKENALEPTLAQFEAYDGGILQAYRWIILPTWNIREKKFHPVRYYVVDREEARILISHATATWLGLMKVLCPNNMPKIKRQVASVSKKTKEQSDHNKKTFLSEPQHPPKANYFIAAPPHPPEVQYPQTVMAKQQQDESPTSHPHSCKRRCHRGKLVHRAVDGHLDHQPVKSHSFQADSNRAMRVQSGQSVSPCSTTTHSQSTIKSLSNNYYYSSPSRTTTPSQSEISGLLPKCQYYQPQEDQETYYISSEATSSVTKTHRTLFQPPHPRSFPDQRSILSTTNLTQSMSAVLRTFSSSTLTLLTDLAHSRENMTLKLTQQSH